MKEKGFPLIRESFEGLHFLRGIEGVLRGGGKVMDFMWFFSSRNRPAEGKGGGHVHFEGKGGGVWKLIRTAGGRLRHGILGRRGSMYHEGWGCEVPKL